MIRSGPGFVDLDVDYEAGGSPSSQGYAAGRDGEPVSACPWKPGTAEALEWTKSWVTSTSDRRHVEGAFGARDEDKADVGLPAGDSVRGKGYSDDVHDLWSGEKNPFHSFVDLVFGPRSGNPVGLKGGPYTHTFTPAVSRYPAAGTYKLDMTIGSVPTVDLTFTCASVDATAIGKAFGIDPALLGLDLDPKARALARKRKPFTCHRHGVQPGGFCRTCTRRTR